MSIPVEYFPVVDGSMTSEDGQTFYFHAKREGGSGVMIGFPHEELPNIVEAAAMQMDRGKSLDGEKWLPRSTLPGSRYGEDRQRKRSWA